MHREIRACLWRRDSYAGNCHEPQEPGIHGVQLAKAGERAGIFKRATTGCERQRAYFSEAEISKIARKSREDLARAR